MIALQEVESRRARLAAFARHRWAVLAVCAVALVADAAWMLQDRHTQSYDQANYLHVAWDYVREARHHLGHLPSYVMHRDPGHGPLYPVLISIPMGIFGPHPACALLVGVAAFIALIFTSALIAERLAGPRAATPTAALVATTPLFYGLSRQVLVDVVLAAFCVAAIYASIRCDRFASRRWTVLLGVFIAFATLTKVTAPSEIAGAAVAGLLLGPRRPTSVALRQRLVNVGIGLGALLALSLWWYGPNFDATRSYIRSTTSGPLSLGAGPTHPLTWPALSAYFLGILQQPLAWVSFAVLLAGLVLCAPRVIQVARGEDRPLRVDVALRAVFVVLWVVPPIALQAASHNQDNRLVGPAILGIVVAAGAVAAAIPRLEARRVVIGLGMVAGAWSLLAHTITDDASLPLLPRDIGFWTPLGHGDYAFDNRAVSFASAPEAHDTALPVVRWMLAERAAHHLDRPVVLGLLQTHPAINGNSIGWLDVRDDGGNRIVVTEAQTAGFSTDQVKAELATYDAVGVIPDIAGDAAQGSRLALLNQQLLGAGATDLLKQFDGDTATFPVDAPGSRIEMHWRGAAATP